MVHITVNLCRRDTISLKGGGEPERRERSKSELRQISLFFCFGIKEMVPFLSPAFFLLYFLNLPFSSSPFFTLKPPSRLKPWHPADFCRGRRQGADYVYYDLPFPGPASACPLPGSSLLDACILYPQSFHGVSEVQISPETE